MAENNRNQGQTSERSTEQNRGLNRDDQRQSTSNQQQQDQNSQRGSQWSNYQTREMSDEGYSDEGLSDEQSA